MTNTASLGRALLAVGVAFLGGFAVAAQAQDDVPKSCLSLGRLERTHAVDDQTILFIMRGSDGEVLRNDLAVPCRDLGRNRGFSYRIMSTRNPRLCKGDLIDIEDSGWTCPIGEFRLISKAEAERLMRGGKDADGASDAASAPAATEPAATETN